MNPTKQKPGGPTGLIIFRRGRMLPVWFSVSLRVASLVDSGLIAQSANFGRQIRPSKIRAGKSIAAVTGEKHR
jgi:hypothetical protein